MSQNGAGQTWHAVWTSRLIEAVTYAGLDEEAGVWNRHFPNIEVIQIRPGNSHGFLGYNAFARRMDQALLIWTMARASVHHDLFFNNVSGLLFLYAPFVTAQLNWVVQNREPLKVRFETQGLVYAELLITVQDRIMSG